MKVNFKEVGIITRCPFCGHAHEVEVNEMDYWDWEDGMCAQDAFPYLSADEREMLISGICPDCWDSMFARGEDEPPEDYSHLYNVDYLAEQPSEDEGETLDDYFHQREIDDLAEVYGGEEPPEEENSENPFAEIFKFFSASIIHPQGFPSPLFPNEDLCRRDDK